MVSSAELTLGAQQLARGSPFSAVWEAEEAQSERVL